MCFIIFKNNKVTFLNTAIILSKTLFLFLLLKNILSVFLINDWITTKKGKEVGGIEKSNQYGKFVIWPENIAKHITE